MLRSIAACTLRCVSKHEGADSVDGVLQAARILRDARAPEPCAKLTLSRALLRMRAGVTNFVRVKAMKATLAASTQTQGFF